MSGAEPFLIGAALAGGASQAIKGVSAYKQASREAKAAKQAALDASADAGSEAQVALEDGARAIGSGITIAAKSGGFGGSAMDVLGDLSRQSMYEARRSATQGYFEAERLREQGRGIKKDANLGLISSFLGASATLMSGGMKAYESGQQRLASIGPRAASSAPTRSLAYGGR